MVAQPSHNTNSKPWLRTPEKDGVEHAEIALKVPVSVEQKHGIIRALAIDCFARHGGTLESYDAGDEGASLCTYFDMWSVRVSFAHPSAVAEMHCNVELTSHDYARVGPSGDRAAKCLAEIESMIDIFKAKPPGYVHLREFGEVRVEDGVTRVRIGRHDVGRSVHAIIENEHMVALEVEVEQPARGGKRSTLRVPPDFAADMLRLLPTANDLWQSLGGVSAKPSSEDVKAPAWVPAQADLEAVLFAVQAETADGFRSAHEALARLMAAHPSLAGEIAKLNADITNLHGALAKVQNARTDAMARLDRVDRAIVESLAK